LSDFNTLDFDLPFATVYVAQSAVLLITGILIMSSVTWQVLIVSILAAVTGYYIKVGAISSLSDIIIESLNEGSEK
jgi:ATP-binding cassette, subfamily C (CFTR/MRP), member 1